MGGPGQLWGLQCTACVGPLHWHARWTVAHPCPLPWPPLSHFQPWSCRVGLLIAYNAYPEIDEIGSWEDRCKYVLPGCLFRAVISLAAAIWLGALLTPLHLAQGGAGHAAGALPPCCAATTRWCSSRRASGRPSATLPSSQQVGVRTQRCVC